MNNSHTALVLGGSRGLGRAICVGLASQGFQVAAHYWQSEDDAWETREACLQAGAPRACLAPCDLRDPKQVTGLLQTLATLFAPVDLVVINTALLNNTPLDIGNAEEESFGVDHIDQPDDQSDGSSPFDLYAEAPTGEQETMATASFNFQLYARLNVPMAILDSVLAAIPKSDGGQLHAIVLHEPPKEAHNTGTVGAAIATAQAASLAAFVHIENVGRSPYLLQNLSSAACSLNDTASHHFAACASTVADMAIKFRDEQVSTLSAG